MRTYSDERPRATHHTQLNFDAQAAQTRRTITPCVFVWQAQETRLKTDSTQYAGYLITHSEPDERGAYESTVTPVTHTTTQPPEIVAYRVAFRGGEEVYRLPYTQRMIDERAARGQDVPRMEVAA